MILREWTPSCSFLVLFMLTSSVSYELDAHYDWHDDMEYRQLRECSEDSTSSDHSRSPSLASSGRSGPMPPQAPIPTIETAVTKKPSSTILRGPQKLRESWPLRSRSARLRNTSVGGD